MLLKINSTFKQHYRIAGNVHCKASQVKFLLLLSFIDFHYSLVKKAVHSLIGLGSVQSKFGHT